MIDSLFYMKKDKCDLQLPKKRMKRTFGPRNQHCMFNLSIMIQSNKNINKKIICKIHNKSLAEYDLILFIIVYKLI